MSDHVNGPPLASQRFRNRILRETGRKSDIVYIRCVDLSYTSEDDTAVYLGPATPFTVWVVQVVRYGDIGDHAQS